MYVSKYDCRKNSFFAIPKLKYVYLNVIVLRMKFDNIPQIDATCYKITIKSFRVNQN